MESVVKKLIISAGLAALVAACASAPQRNDQLEQARAELQTLSADPLVQQAASADADAARASLQQAEAALQQKKPPETVNHLAYLALRHAQAGEARVAEAHARQEVARGEQERNRVMLEAREREAQNAKSEAETAKNTASAAQSELASARQELLALQAKQTDRGPVMTLSDVLFDTGRATLKPGADRDLDRLAQALKDNSNTRVIIEGHTDSVGSDSYNEELSRRRAQAVADALHARGVPAERLEAKGLGKSYPVASNASVAGRQQNRRVEIVFSDDAGRFAQGGSQGSSSR
jgi:outer membrane protein OmpA-like peptidoglycan-associated protein